MQTKLGFTTSSLAALQSKINIAISDLGDDLCANLDAFKRVLERRMNGDQKVAMCELNGLPRTIRFPYARHSSYPEICELVNLFKPSDVWPCTEDPVEWQKTGKSITSGRFARANKLPIQVSALRHYLASIALVEYSNMICSSLKHYQTIKKSTTILSGRLPR